MLSAPGECCDSAKSSGPAASGPDRRFRRHGPELEMLTEATGKHVAELLSDVRGAIEKS